MVGPNIEHHGIKGQRWGVRRFQNKDGTLTSAGKKRYGLSADGGRKEYNLRRNTVSVSSKGNTSKRSISDSEKETIKQLEEIVNKHSRNEISLAQYRKSIKKLLDKNTEIDYDNAGIMMEGSPGKSKLISLTIKSRKGKTIANRIITNNSNMLLQQMHQQQELFNGQVQVQNMIQQQQLNQTLMNQQMMQTHMQMHHFM